MYLDITQSYFIIYCIFNVLLLQKRSQKNAENRNKKEYNHCGGSRPYQKHMEAAVQVIKASLVIFSCVSLYWNKLVLNIVFSVLLVHLMCVDVGLFFENH